MSPPAADVLLVRRLSKAVNVFLFLADTGQIL